ncbi:alcohol acetyltransferase [Delphinella strobiligena]|nr:alcohol acetyltransferase [Delphinella strobiligena]
MERLRAAGPNERRCIVRQALDYYRTLIVGGIYVSNGNSYPLQDTLIKALKHCVSTHPILSAVIADEETEVPAFAKPPTIDLDNHVEILDVEHFADQIDTHDESNLIKTALTQTHDRRFTHRSAVPPWKIVALPLLNRTNGDKSRFLILLAYYHSHGDGKSGLAFHKAFLEGLQLPSSPDCRYDSVPICTTTTKQLPPPMEQAGKLYISWTYLLSPLLGVYLPKFISRPLGIRASATPEAEDPFRGRHTSHDPNNFHTGVEMLNVSDETMQKVLTRCRTEGAKFTGLLHQLIVRALSEAVPVHMAGSFVSQTAVDLRRNLDGITDDDMSLCPTGYYEAFKRTDSDFWKGWATLDSESPVWAAARTTTEGLAECAGRMVDQPVGLLSCLSKFYPWMRGQIGKARDESYEVSNLLCFNPPTSEVEGCWELESMVFSQPANATGSCMSFNVVSRKGGDFTLVMAWQLDGLGVHNEQEFAKAICASIGASIRELADA